MAITVYRVGGAVRDSLLGYPFHETDWVVVGGTPEDLLNQGFQQVGRDFPVFLHPVTKEEYALARTERKKGHGYHGFEVHADPSVTLEQDLSRRDLTINAMAMTTDGDIIDPYGGQADLQARVLRHVSTHFVEDPLRVLRVARFAARYHPMGFSIAAETMALMTDIVATGELAHLSQERIWTETERALGEQQPAVYFRVLARCNALQTLFPALAVTAGIELLERAAPYSDRIDVRWSALLAELPGDRAQDLCAKLRVPKAAALLSTKVCALRTATRSALQDASHCMALLEALDALRRDEPFTGFCDTLAALEGTSAAQHPALQQLAAAKATAAQITIQHIDVAGLTGAAIGDALRSARQHAIAEVLAAR